MLGPNERGQGSRGKRPRNPEIERVVPVAGGEPEAAGRAKVARKVVPGTAADDTASTIAGIPGCPRRAIRRRSGEAVVVAILRPFDFREPDRGPTGLAEMNRPAMSDSNFSARRSSPAAARSKIPTKMARSFRHASRIPALPRLIADRSFPSCAIATPRRRWHHPKIR
jgi:hypothetical protein